MKLRTLSTIALLICGVTVSLAISGSGTGQEKLAPTAQPTGLSDKRIARQTPNEILADKIIVGLVSEEEFTGMNLSSDEILEVFKHIRDRRGWTMDDQELEASLGQYRLRGSQPDIVEMSVTGGCDHFIPLQSGTRYAAYPVYRTPARRGECGPDTNELILVYNTPNWPNTNTANIRVECTP